MGDVAGGKKKAADAAKDEQSISDAQSTGTKVWKDLEEQRKLTQGRKHRTSLSLRRVRRT